MNATLNFKLTLPGIQSVPTAGLMARIMKRFAENAGIMIVAAVRSHLGQDSLYQLSPEYAARKATMKGLKRYPGKSSDQPIILTGDIFEHVMWEATGDGLIVHVADNAGMDRGFDVSEHWEQITGYLELGLAEVEDDLPDVLLDIIVGEMAL